MNISSLFLSLKREPALGALSETPLKTALGGAPLGTVLGAL